MLKSREGPAAGRELDILIHRTRVMLMAVDAEQAEIARIAWRKFGKGSHGAGLNFGDCTSYALAKVAGEPPLAKGDDFSHTDIKRAA